MPSGNPDFTCNSCNIDWSAGKYSPECPECGGAAMQTPCPFCKGICGAKWDRSAKDSHVFSKAQWAGHCKLPEREQKKIRDNRLKDYEKGLNGKTEAINPSWWNSGSKFMARAFRLAVIIGVMAIVRNCDDIKQHLGLNRTTDGPIVSATPRGKDINSRFSGFNYGSGKIYFSEMTSTYSLTGDGYYELTKTKSVIKSELIFDGVELRPEKEIDTTLPDKNLGEYARIMVSRDSSSNITLKNEALFIDPAGHEFHFESEAQVELVNGDFSDIGTETPVVLRYTDKGLRKLRKDIEDIIRTEYQLLFGPEMTSNPTPLFVLQITEMANETITIDRNFLYSVSDGPMVVEFRSMANKKVKLRAEDIFGD